MIVFDFFNFLLISAYYATGYLIAARFQKASDREALRGQWIYNYMVRMGPLYIKIGQILATRSDLIAPAIANQLRQLQDDVPPSDQNYVKEILKTELGRPLEQIFTEFNFVPVASASIAQVHAAVLHTGQKVAVKIVKNQVRSQLEKNLRICQFIIKVLHQLSAEVRQLNLIVKFEELYGLLIAQTDMRQEAQRQATIYINFKNHPYVIVPQLVPELCSASVLIMEYMEGIKGKDADQVEIPAAQLARRLQDTIYTMLYMDGICHGDPHPGNIFFTKEGKIILLDFGITVELSEEEKWGLSSFYYACTRKEWDLAVKRLNEYFVVHKTKASAAKVLEQWSDFERDIMAVLRQHLDIRLNRWSTIAYFQDLNLVLKKYEAQYTTNFTKVELVFLSCEGFVTQIDPDIDIWENACKFTDRFSPYMNDQVKARFDQYFAEANPTSIQLRDRAKTHLVAPTHIDRFFFPSTYPLFIKNASGSHLEDVDGNIYIDLSCGYGPHILGYAHPAVTTALTAAVQLGSINALGNLPEVELAETIVQAFPGADKCIFSNSGTEAVIQAIRLCRAYRQRDRVVKFEGHYHGFSDQGMVSSWFRFAGSKTHPQPIDGSLGSEKSTVQNTIVLQYGDPLGLERLRVLKDEVACVICEPMPTMMASYDQPFLQQLRQVCTDWDLPLIFDEIVSGFRVAYGGVQTLIAVTPDLTCLGKIIGGGLPCGAVVGKSQLIDIAKTSEDPFLDYETKTFVGGTMSGNSLSCTAGLAALTHLHQHPEIYTQLEEYTNQLAQELQQIARSHQVPFQIKANRSIFAMSFSHKTAKLVREKSTGGNFKANLALAYYMRKYQVYMPELHTLMLNAAHTTTELTKVADAFDRTLKEMVEDGFFVL